MSEYQLLKRLDEEHRVIEELAGSFVTFSEKINNTEQKDIILKYALLFKNFVDDFHHKKEEDILIPSFIKHEIDENSGPIQVILTEHKNNKEIINRFINLGKDFSLEDIPNLQKDARLYCANIWEHIDKEDSVLFPEAETRISGQAKKDDDKLLREFEKGDIYENFLKECKELIKNYPPVEILEDYSRGEGCNNCHEFGVDCQGIEEEWWTENEWEDFNDRYM